MPEETGRGISDKFLNVAYSIHSRAISFLLYRLRNNKKPFKERALCILSDQEQVMRLCWK